MSPVYLRVITKRDHGPKEDMWPVVELWTSGDSGTVWYCNRKLLRKCSSEAILILPALANYYINQRVRKFSLYLKDNQLFKAKIMASYYEVCKLCRTKFITRVQSLGRKTYKYIITYSFTPHKAV